MLKSLLVLMFFVFSSQGFANNGKFVRNNYNGPVPQKNGGGGNMLYYGGNILATPRVVTVFWSSKVDATVQKEMGNFYKSLMDSDVMDWLSQYNTNIKAVDGRQGTNQTMTHGVYDGEFVITPKIKKNKIDDREIAAEIEAQIIAHNLPTPGDSTLYMVHFPKGVTIMMDGAASCSSFCAYHYFYESKTVGTFYYGVMPDFGSGMCGMSCGSGSSMLDTTTFVSSHELFEAINDPVPTPGDKPAFPQAWNTAGGEEIADLCQNSTPFTTATKTYAMSELWDNSQRKCSGGPFHSPSSQ